MNQNQPVSTLPEKRSKPRHKLVNVLYVILVILLCVIPAIEQITTVTLTWNRAVPAGPVSCTVQKSLFPVLPLGHFEIPDVRGAKVSQSVDPDGDLSQRIELFTTEDIVPLTTSYYAGSRPYQRDAVARINALIHATEPGTVLVTEHLFAGLSTQQP